MSPNRCVYENNVEGCFIIKIPDNEMKSNIILAIMEIIPNLIFIDFLYIIFVFVLSELLEKSISPHSIQLDLISGFSFLQSSHVFMPHLLKVVNALFFMSIT